MDILRLCFIFGLLLIPFAARAQVTFSEIAWMGTSASQFAEWIELHNTGTVSVNLSGGGIYRSGGSTLLFPLTKSIEPGGYLVIERTTASVPDAVAGVNDEAGPFLGGSLPNLPGGEHLVLKDASGSVLDTLNALLGWPAGDNSTKETMQRSSSGWVTAVATPKAGFSADSGISPQSSTSGTSTGSSTPSAALANISSNQSADSSAGSLVSPDFSISIGRERLASVGSPVAFSVAESGATSGTLSYHWSFGDGSMSIQKKPVHIYRYPGDYVVVLSAGSEELHAVARTIVHVVPVDVQFALRPDDGRIDLMNNSAYEINIGDWNIAYGDAQFQLPSDTIVLPKKRVSIPRTVSRFVTYMSSSTPRLSSPEGVVEVVGVVAETQYINATSSSVHRGISADLSRDLARLASSLREALRLLEVARLSFE